ncbi:MULTISPECIES: Rab family GTPase [Alteromonadaceae]|uniref:Rab family GTPase n=1 Tax=Alteromonadaceae TaxID=72275 RepID=UPI001C0A15B5|nr:MULTISPECIES: Rab family GTPase [Aliiglaciecola]MBU2879505.1 GTP-binding protein [Aliiglaciecola lipolytica]MDO6712574.1 Rab family GTPase [Aliiglaciecola sp. 2_MG-2023]MDO6753682.1 Rab family GTPase [Aliiglaciecola sp. 1_MG-2023]
MLQKKICLLGPSGVGKTSLVKQFVEGIFSEKYLTTIGVKIDKKLVDLVVEQVQLMIWDLEGIDRYCGFQPKYLRGASAYAIVTDQTRSQSLVEGMEIHRMVREISDIPAILIINKSDLDVAWHWTENELNGYSKEFIRSFSTSAKTGDQVEEMFKFIAQLTLN